MDAAAHLVGTYDLPRSKARIELACRNPSAALETLERWQRQAEARGWEDERLAVLVLQALTLWMQGVPDQAVRRLHDALQLGEPGGYLRLFADEGATMTELLRATAAAGFMPDFIERVLEVCRAEEPRRKDVVSSAPVRPLVEPLSRREREVLQLIAVGLSNQEIAGRLVLALETVKGHNKRIFGKLQVQRRTEAVARARDLGVL
jgi:LuxR family maltose regulon positive regulatory protein